MLNKLHLCEIVKNGHKSLYHEIDGHKGSLWQKIIIFDFFPFAIAILLILFTNFQTKLPQFSSDILSGLSLFSGLLFSLIVVIVDKAKARKGTLLSSENEEEKNYLKKYLLYSEQLVTQISLSIIYSFVVILLLILSLIKIEHLNISYEQSSIIASISVFFITYFSIQFFLLILLIISGMYSIFINDIDN